MANEDGPAEASGLSRHLRRYGAFYVIAIIVAVLAVVLPGQGDDDDDGGGDDTEEVAAGDETDEGDGEWRPASGDVELCEDGGQQVPDLQYSLPCVEEFTGDNGGATHRGVTADTIKIVIREFPTTANSQESDRQIREAGFATADDTRAIRDQFREFYNENFELYGRKVEFVRYESRFSNSTT